MEDLYSPQSVRRLLRRYNISPKKKLGQNFLTDSGVSECIADTAFLGKGDLAVEIGPGLGALTRILADRAGTVLAVELDEAILPVLEGSVAGFDNVEIEIGDILRIDLAKRIEAKNAERAETCGKPYSSVKIFGNLPYYITTPIIMKLLEDGVPVSVMTFMVQKEVAERISSPPGSRIYGAISPAVQYRCEVEYVCTVPPEVFVPKPAVESAIIKLSQRKEKPIELISEELFFECIKKGFSTRRKTLANSLSGLKGLSKREVEEILEEVGIDPLRRSETLSVEDFGRLANRLAAEPAILYR